MPVPNIGPDAGRIRCNIQRGKARFIRGIAELGDRTLIGCQHDSNVAAAGTTGFVNNAKGRRDIEKLIVTSIEYPKIMVNAELS